MLSSGNTERVKCAVIYKVTEGGAQIRQSMRCASADYNINALGGAAREGRAGLRQLGGEDLLGHRARSRAATPASSFVLSIQGANFSAAMNVSLSDCKQ